MLRGLGDVAQLLGLEGVAREESFVVALRPDGALLRTADGAGAPTVKS